MEDQERDYIESWELLTDERQAHPITCASCGLSIDHALARDPVHDHCGPLPHTGPIGGPYCDDCA